MQFKPLIKRFDLVIRLVLPVVINVALLLLFRHWPVVKAIVVYITITLAVLWCWLYVLRFFASQGKKKGDVVLRRNRKIFRSGTLLVMAFGVYMFASRLNPATFIMMLTGCLLPVQELIFLIRVRRHHPAGLVVEGDVLYINGNGVLRKHLCDLYEIDLNGLNNAVGLRFKKGRSAFFRADEFSKADLKIFFKVVVVKSKHQITLPKNLQFYLDNQDTDFF